MAMLFGMLHRLTDKFVASGQPVSGAPLIEVIGDRRVLVENHLGVCEYGESQICVNSKIGRIVIQGNELELAQMSKEQLVVTGIIGSISVERG